MAGAMCASLAAGPAFLGSLALAAWATEAPATYVIGLSAVEAGGAIGMAFGATLFGFLLSMVPNIVGSWFMHGLGIGNFAAQLPVVWALAGAGMAGLPFVFIPGLANDSLPIATVFAVTGASCALIAHRFTAWS